MLLFSSCSGPVTAGVLRGDRARFQLFGDTMNLASRMESTGVPGRIQISSDTAKLLMDEGKESWITPRDEMIVAKGKGQLKTYWLLPDKQDTVSTFSSEDNNKIDRTVKDMMSSFSPLTGRTIKWHVDYLARLLKNIAAKRSHQLTDTSREQLQLPPTTGTVLDEVQDSISLPEMNTRRDATPETIVLDSAVITQLHEFVATLACMYRNNGFHNFDVSVSESDRIYVFSSVDIIF